MRKKRTMSITVAEPIRVEVEAIARKERRTLTFIVEDLLTEALAARGVSIPSDAR
jgi:hypothetical protein